MIQIINAKSARINEDDGTLELTATDQTGMRETSLTIPIVAEIEPHTDPIYGHTFRWPQEVAQYLADQPTPTAG